MMQAGAVPRLLVGHGASSERTMKSIWIGGRRKVEVPCSIEIERTADTLHAHVSLEGIDVELGDEVLVHDSPTHIEFGERIVTSSRATISRATPIERALTRLQSYLHLTELYEVGFQPRNEIIIVPVTTPAMPDEEKKS